MIRHIVLVKFRPEITGDEKQAIYDALDDLRGHLSGVGEFRAGPNVSVETDLIRGNHDAFTVDFADVAARDAYLADEQHRAVGARLVAAAEGGIDGITVFDMEL